MSRTISGRKRTALGCLAFPLVILGFCTFLGGFLISSGATDYDGELPLGDIKGLVVDSEENIYVGLGFYGRIQVYNKDGNYSHHWRVNAGSGTFKMFLEDGNIVIVTARGDKKITYDKNGIVLTKEPRPNEYSSYKNISASSFKTEDGIDYNVSGVMFYDIVKHNTTEEVIVSQSFLLKMLKGPIPAWLYAAAGILLGLISFKGKWRFWEN